MMATITWNDALKPATPWSAANWLSVKSDDRDLAENISCTVSGLKGAMPTAAPFSSSYCGVYRGQKDENPPKVEEKEETEVEETEEEETEKVEVKTCQPW